MPEIYSTADIWLGALFLSETDARLVSVQTNSNGRKTISFAFSGNNLTQKAEEYCQEQALANVAQLRKHLNDLRDLIFAQKHSV